MNREFYQSQEYRQRLRQEAERERLISQLREQAEPSKPFRAQLGRLLIRIGKQLESKSMPEVAYKA